MPELGDFPAVGGKPPQPWEMPTWLKVVLYVLGGAVALVVLYFFFILFIVALVFLAVIALAGLVSS